MLKKDIKTMMVKRSNIGVEIEKCNKILNYFKSIIN